MYLPDGVWWTIVAFMVGHDTIDEESRSRWFVQMVDKMYQTKSMVMWNLNLDLGQGKGGRKAIDLTSSICIYIQHNSALGQYGMKDLIAFKRVCGLIKCCPRLERVDFRWLRLTDGVLIPQLIGILETNKSIRAIDVTGNNLTDFDVLTNALNGNKSI